MEIRRVLVMGAAVLVLVGAAGPGVAQVGTTGASFLKLGVGARAEALGGAGVVGLEGIESLYWNPAGLATGDGSAQILVSHQQLWQDIHTTAFALGYSGWGFGSLALGIERVGVESWNNLPDGSGVDAGDMAVVVGYARPLMDRMNVGVAVRTLHATIGDASSNGFSLDVGLRYRLTDRLTVASAARNLGPGLSFSDEAEDDPLPTAGSLGAGYERGMLSILGEVRTERGVDAYGVMAGEIRPHPMLALRGGVRVGGVERAASDFSWGLGAGRPDGFRVDYSYRDSDLGSTHHFSGTVPLSVGGGLGGGRPATLDRAAIPTNLAIVKGLMAAGIDSLLRILPALGGGVIIDRRVEDGGSGRGMESENGAGDRLVEDLLTERLTQAGLAVHVGRLAASEDSTISETEPLPVLEYRVIELNVSYPSGRRRHYIGQKELNRAVQVHLHLRLLDGVNDMVRWAGTVERSYSDIVPFGVLGSLKSEGFGFTEAEAGERKWDKVLEPVIATAIIGGLIYLFYSNKGEE